MEDFKLSYKVHFNCGHKCSEPQLSEDENKIKYGEEYSQTGFGHNYVLTVTVQLNDLINDPKSKSLPFSIRETKAEVKSLAEHIKDRLDHKFLNDDLEHFQTVVPTLENICKYCFSEGLQYLQQKNSQWLLNRIDLEEGYFWKATATLDPKYL